jgi:prenyltransferase beta subunit
MHEAQRSATQTVKAIGILCLMEDSSNITVALTRRRIEAHLRRIKFDARRFRSSGSTM